MMLAPNGEKLSKRHGAVSVTEYRDQGYSPARGPQLPRALRLVARRPGGVLARRAGRRVRLGALRPERRQVRRQEVPRHRPRAPEDAAAHRRRRVRRARAAVPRAARARRASSARAREGGRAAHPRARDHVRRGGRPARLLLPRGARGRRGGGGEVPRPRPARRSSRGSPTSIGAVEPWTAQALEERVDAWLAEKGLQIKDVAQPARVALTGRTASPGLFDVIAVLGKERAVARLTSPTSPASPPTSP